MHKETGAYFIYIIVYTAVFIATEPDRLVQKYM